MLPAASLTTPPRLQAMSKWLNSTPFSWERAGVRSVERSGRAFFLLPQ